jgi:hypothetical protein
VGEHELSVRDLVRLGVVTTLRSMAIELSRTGSGASCGPRLAARVGQLMAYARELGPGPIVDTVDACYVAERALEIFRCEHVWVRNPYDSRGALCERCWSHAPGRHCPKNPKGLCEYAEAEGVTLERCRHCGAARV